MSGQEEKATRNAQLYRDFHQQREARRRQRREQLRQSYLEKTSQAIREVAPRLPSIQRVYLFGSLMVPGRFDSHSDIDVAVESEDVAAESQFWRALEEVLQWNVDVRPYEGVIVQAVANNGECVYAREGDCPGAQHSE